VQAFYLCHSRISLTQNTRLPLASVVYLGLNTAVHTTIYSPRVTVNKLLHDSLTTHFLYVGILIMMDNNVDLRLNDPNAWHTVVHTAMC